MESSKEDTKIERSRPPDHSDNEAQLEPAALSRALKGRHMQMIAIGRFFIHLTLYSYWYMFCQNRSRGLHRRWSIRRFGNCISQWGAGKRGEYI